MTWHTQGTVSVTKNSSTVTGSGTNWVENIRVGDGFNGPDGRMYQITNVASNTSIAIAPVYAGSNATVQSYAVVPVQGYVKKSADRLATVVNEIEDMPTRLSTLENSAVMESRRISTSDLLTGGGNLSANRTISIAQGIVPENPINLGHEINLNDITVKGFCIQTGSATATPERNFPISNAGVLISLYTGAVQLYIAYNTRRQFLRSRASDGTWHSWEEFYSTVNTTVDSNGFIKSASPIIKLFSNSIEKTKCLEIESTTFERIDVGHYVLRSSPRLSRDGWYIETPKDRNGNIYFYLDYEEDENGTLTIKTYAPDYSSGRAEAGAPMDIVDGRFVSLRFEEDPSLYPETEEMEEE